VIEMLRLANAGPNRQGSIVGASGQSKQENRFTLSLEAVRNWIGHTC